MRKDFFLSVLYLTAIFLISSCKNADVDKKTAQSQVNYGHNIIVLVDFSNRLQDEKMISDSQIVGIILSKLIPLFQSSIDRGINDKFIITSFNTLDFQNCNFPSGSLGIDLTKFGSEVALRSEYLYHNKGDNSFKHDSIGILKDFSSLYNCLKSGKQLPADVGYFLKEKLTYPLVDTSSTEYDYRGTHFVNRYENYVIVITDGYIEAGRDGSNPGMKENNKYRYLGRNSVIPQFRENFSRSGQKDYVKFFTDNSYGLIPLENPSLKYCKFLCLEFYDRSLNNGVTTKNPTDFEIQELFWKDWFIKSGVKANNIVVKATVSNEQTLGRILDDFLNKL